MKKVRHILLSGLIALFLASTLLAVNIFQVLTLIIYPFSRSAFFYANRIFADKWWGLCVWVVNRVHQVPIRFSGDELDKDGNGIIISNHQSMADILVIFDLAVRQKRVGDLKWFIKDAIKWFPGVGWGLLFLNSVFVKRDWNRDANRISKAFHGLISSKMPFYMVLFPEGTRIKPSKLAESVKFTNKAGLLPMNHVLFPRTKGFVATIKGLRQDISAVYDVTIRYNGDTPTLWQWFTSDPGLVEVFVKKYPKNFLPDEPKALSEWLIQVYREKDARLGEVN